MTFDVIWDEAALDAATQFLKGDPDGLRQLMDAADLLAEQPRPAGSAEHHAADPRRVHVGRYRAMHEITETTGVIVVIHIGRIGMGQGASPDERRRLPSTAMRNPAPLATASPAHPSCYRDIRADAPADPDRLRRTLSCGR